MDRILDAIAKAPMAAKAGVVAAIVVLLTALNYFVFSIPTFGSSISETEDRIAKIDVEQKRIAVAVRPDVVSDEAREDVQREDAAAPERLGSLGDKLRGALKPRDSE